MQYPTHSEPPAVHDQCPATQSKIGLTAGLCQLLWQPAYLPAHAHVVLQLMQLVCCYKRLQALWAAVWTWGIPAKCV